MTEHDGTSPVIVVGGGASGLSSAAALAHLGIESVVLDQDETIGGTWKRRYRSLRLHTIRRFSGLACYPIPRQHAQYLSKDQYAAYLQEYAKALELDVSLGERVHKVQRLDGTGKDSSWELLTSQRRRRARCVIMATGLYAKPYMPTWPGSDAFAGEILHSSQYDAADAYQGRSVLVIGLGNSGAEIAADLASHGAGSVSVSVRTAPPIVTREMFGIVPVQLFGIALTPIGIPNVIDRCTAALRRVSIGDLTEYGLGKAAWGPFTARRPAVIDTGFLRQLKQKRITIRPGIDHFDSASVVYKDQSRDAVDVVIAATGFRTGLDKILAVSSVIDKAGHPRPDLTIESDAPGLYFVGFDETVRGQLFEINRQSRQVAAEVKDYLG